MNAAAPAEHRPTSPRREAAIAERQRLGHDGRDEVWEGVYVMSPAARNVHGRLQMLLGAIFGPASETAGLWVVGPYNIGTPDDYRIPDLGLMRPGEYRTFGTGDTVVVIEIVSPDDDTFKKFGFYFRHGVEEIVVVDPETRHVGWYRRGSGGFEPAEVSSALGMSSADIAAALEW
jgi:Putative restriction endonuclease